MRDFTRLIVKAFLFIALPWAAIEVGVRIGLGPEWFERAEIEMRAHEVRALFIGSSRTAAVDAAVFETEIEKRTGKRPRALNLAMGYSTVAEYHLALQWLLERHPERFRSLTVFFGVQAGFPSNASWDSSWYNGDKPALLAPWLTPGSLQTLLARPDLSVSDRAYFALGSLSKAVRQGPALRGLVQDSLRGALLALAGQKRPSAADADFPAAAGIRPDETGLAIARAQAVRYADSMRHESPISQWKGIVAETVRMLRNAGSEVVFLSEPLSPLMEKAAQGPESRASRLAFLRQASTWGSRLLEPRIPTQESDFPDGWHLRASRSAEFTRALVAAYLGADASPTPTPQPR